MTLIKNNSKTIISILIGLVVIQAIFWYTTKRNFPKLSIVDTAPSSRMINAISFGENQFYFRKMGLELQFMGDTYNRITPLKDYDYSKLYDWFTLLDQLDSKSDFVAATAGYYFALSQNPEDARYVIKFLREHANKNLTQKWWWMLQASLIATQLLKDNKLALEIAYELSDVKTPIQITKFLPAIILNKTGNKAVAQFLINDIMKNGFKLEAKDLPYISFFLESLQDHKK